jgi:pyrimidine deaminase RibD-like protein
MLPRVEQGRSPDYLSDSSWNYFKAQALLRLLQREFNPLEDPRLAQQSNEDFMRTLEEYGDRRTIARQCEVVREHLTDFLFNKRAGSSSSLQLLDRHLAATSYLAAQVADHDIFARVLKESLGNSITQRYQALAATTLRQDTPGLTMNYRELGLVSTVFRNLVSYGMWKSIEVSKQSQAAALREHKARAYVGSVALDSLGNILETGYRGEDSNRSRHSEDILLSKLQRSGLLSQAAVVAVNLEPCAVRSEKHREHLGHTKGCSQLLLESGVPIVGYVIGDGSRHDRGRGGEVLSDHDQVLVFQADVPLAIATAAGIQDLPHLNQVAMPLEFAKIS